MGIEDRRVAVLSAVETLQTKMASTLDAAVLSKMADRGQIVGAVVDGPLDLDAAVDAEAARIKGIVSPVAGRANILIVPNIEAGNMIYTEFAFMADAQTAGLVVGARARDPHQPRGQRSGSPIFRRRGRSLRRRSGADSTAIFPGRME